MNKAFWIGTALCGLAGALPARAQDNPNWVESRFERVHLANGNFIDGHLVEESDNLLTFRIVGGEIGIRKDAVQRNSSGKLRIELMKMRSYKDAPTLQATAKPKALAAPETAKTTPAPVAAPEAASEAVELKGTPTEQLEQAIQIVKEGVLGRQKGAIRAMANLGPQAAAFLAELLPTAKDELVPTISIALQNRQEAVILTSARPLLKHDRALVREAAATLVGFTGNAKEDGEAVRDLLSDSQIQVRGAALDALRQLGDFDSFSQVSDLLGSTDAGIRAKALGTLISFSQKGGLGKKLAETLAKQISQASDQAKLELVTEAAKLGEKELAPTLERLMSDSDPMIRSHAIMGIAKINAPEYAVRILEMLNSEREYWPRIQLAGAVQVMRLDEGVDKMIDWLGDSDSNVRAAALRTLRALSRMNFGGERAPWEEWRSKTRRQ